MQSNIKIYDAIDENQYNKYIFDEMSGGFIAVHKAHGRNELEQNLEIARILAQQGERIFLLEDIKNNPSPEFAARGGVSVETHGRVSLPEYKFAGSNNIDSVAWHDRNTNKTKPVGIKAPNELNIHDMSGNVWELCNNCYKRWY